ncbi:hypothetical protein POZ03_16785 [Bacteroides uniformis]|uniref:hypothetical protein n=1 Tax=Bacteroides uniformis TaxID=820 RepID=UPI00233F5089|nr:hypothetical protein [Bacteroides uniformis]MDC1812117.1 hypothetical protein [Bacteroides uniformis]
MKEYIAQTGGRYTYADDILNLQELALSMTSIFTTYSNFIISGCEYTGNDIAPGYVWINGKVRYFSGCKNATRPYYIYETNKNETVTYANEINKNGRSLYLCTGGATVPEVADLITGKVPQYIELTADYVPRFADKFFGQYAVLLDSPFGKQTIKRDLVLAGNLTVEKNIECKTAISISNAQNGYSIRNIVKANGDASIGVYLNGLLVNEIVILTDGSFSFIKQGQELARINNNGIYHTHIQGTTSKTGSIYLSNNSLTNYDDDSDDGSININTSGLKGGNAKFRNFNIYDGKQSSAPLFQTIGKDKTIRGNGAFTINIPGDGIILANPSYLKNNTALTNCYIWLDSQKEKIGSIGYEDTSSFDMTIRNIIGNITFASTGYVNITGTLKINGKSVEDIYVTRQDFNTELGKKVDAVAGKQLSTEDFTNAYKKKLDAISGGSIESAGDGFVTSKDVSDALKLKLTITENLRDIPNKGTARTNLDVYSKSEANGRYLKVTEKLLELVSLSADEVNGLTADEAAALKAQKQEAVRNNIDAEKKGTGNLKLTKASNLADIPDKAVARKNISVYSTKEIDDMLAGKLGNEGAYQGAIFTNELKQKLESIKSGNFAYTDNNGTSHSEVEGYVSTSQVKKELTKKAERLLSGYSDNEKRSIAANIGIYLKTETDEKYAAVSSLFQDYIAYLVKQGKSSAEAQKTLRTKLDVLSSGEVSGTYIRKDSKLSDLSLPNAEAKKQVCRTLGAAYAEEYQTKLPDTGWLQMNNSGSSTDTRGLFVRQIGNVVCIQGTINTAKRDGSNMGGAVAVLPNQISAPKYGLKLSLCDFNDDHKYNRGATFVIPGNSRKILIYESGWYNINTEINFTYMI